MRNVSHNSYRESQTHILCPIPFFLRKSRLLWDSVEKYGRACQATDGSIIRCMPFAYSITKATYTLRILLLFHGSNGYANAPHGCVICAIPLLLIFYFRLLLGQVVCILWRQNAEILRWKSMPYLLSPWSGRAGQFLPFHKWIIVGLQIIIQVAS
jgi:hypothetical protein